MRTLMQVLCLLVSLPGTLVRWADRYMCARGYHAPPVWRRATERPPVFVNRATEMLYASGLSRLARWNGWCPRCGQLLAWASYDPRPAKERRVAQIGISAGGAR